MLLPQWPTPPVRGEEIKNYIDNKMKPQKDKTIRKEKIKLFMNCKLCQLGLPCPNYGKHTNTYQPNIESFSKDDGGGYVKIKPKKEKKPQDWEKEWTEREVYYSSEEEQIKWIKALLQKTREEMVEEIEKSLVPFHWENNKVLWRTIDEKDWKKLKTKLK